MNQLPLDLENIIYDYKYQLEQSHKYKLLMFDVLHYDFDRIHYGFYNNILRVNNGSYNTYLIDNATEPFHIWSVKN